MDPKPDMALRAWFQALSPLLLGWKRLPMGTQLLGVSFFEGTLFCEGLKENPLCLNPAEMKTVSLCLS